MGCGYPVKTHYQSEWVAANYARRTTTATWRAEQLVFEALIGSLPKGCSMLDLPVGTFRFFPLYQEGAHRAVGMDISAAMLAQAAREARDAAGTLELMRGDAEAIPLADRAVDYVVSARFLNWLPFDILRAVLREFKRVSRRGIIIQVRRTEAAPLRARALGTTRELIRYPRQVLPLMINGLKGALGITYHYEGRRYHDGQALGQLFAELGLTVRRQMLVDAGVNYSFAFLRYTPMMVFLLESA